MMKYIKRFIFKETILSLSYHRYDIPFSSFDLEKGFWEFIFCYTKYSFVDNVAFDLLNTKTYAAQT